MAKLPRETLVQFGKDGTTDDFETFGSTAAGSTVYSKDISDIQATAEWLTGWRSALIASKAPVLQDMNAKMLVDSYMMAYLMQQGVPEYDAATTYFIGSLVMKVSTAEMYMSAINTNVGNALPSRVSDANWTYVGLLTSVYQLSKYRRPNLVYGSGTTATIETGLNGTSGQGLILFPDGVSIADSTSGHIVLNVAQVASLGASPQSGVQTGTIADNTWYAVYAVKANSAANFVLVADTHLPLQANYATLNSNFGVNGWVYLGLIRNGDNGGNASGILNFVQSGDRTIFANIGSGSSVGGLTPVGITLADTGSATTLIYTYAAGTGAAQIPANIRHAVWSIGNGGIAASISILNAALSKYLIVYAPNNLVSLQRVENPATEGLKAINSITGATTYTIWLSGFTDAALGVGSNPVL